MNIAGEGPIASVRVDAHRWYAKVHLTPVDPAQEPIVLVFDASIQAGDGITWFASEEEWHERLQEDGVE